MGEFEFCAPIIIFVVVEIVIIFLILQVSFNIHFLLVLLLALKLKWMIIVCLDIDNTTIHMFSINILIFQQLLKLAHGIIKSTTMLLLL